METVYIVIGRTRVPLRVYENLEECKKYCEETGFSWLPITFHRQKTGGE